MTRKERPTKTLFDASDWRDSFTAYMTNVRGFLMETEFFDNRVFEYMYH